MRQMTFYSKIESQENIKNGFRNKKNLRSPNHANPLKFYDFIEAILPNWNKNRLNYVVVK